MLDLDVDRNLNRIMGILCTDEVATVSAVKVSAKDVNVFEFDICRDINGEPEVISVNKTGHWGSLDSGKRDEGDNSGKSDALHGYCLVWAVLELLTEGRGRCWRKEVELGIRTRILC